MFKFKLNFESDRLSTLYNANIYLMQIVTSILSAKRSL